MTIHESVIRQSGHVGEFMHVKMLHSQLSVAEKKWQFVSYDGKTDRSGPSLHDSCTKSHVAKRLLCYLR